MSTFLTLSAVPRTTCGAVSRVQILTLVVLTVFVTVMVLLGQPLTVAAGVAGWLVGVVMPAAASAQRNVRKSEV